MIDDAFKLTLDVHFPPPKDQVKEDQGKSSEAYKVDGYKDNENIWEHIYTLKPQWDKDANHYLWNVIKMNDKMRSYKNIYLKCN